MPTRHLYRLLLRLDHKNNWLKKFQVYSEGFQIRAQIWYFGHLRIGRLCSSNEFPQGLVECFLEDFVCMAPIFCYTVVRIRVSINCYLRWRYIWAWDPKWGYTGVNKLFVLKFVLFVLKTGEIPSNYRLKILYKVERTPSWKCFTVKELVLSECFTWNVYKSFLRVPSFELIVFT